LKVGSQVVLSTVGPLVPDLSGAPQPVSLFHRTWPLAGLLVALIATVAWIGLLGYGFFKLVEPAFS
jgi:hypothetical protein